MARVVAGWARMHRAPAILVTDGGPEFDNANVRALRARHNIERRFQEPGGYSTAAKLLSPIHISEPTRPYQISDAVFGLKKKNKQHTA